jgi:hypothetical protein
MESQTEEQVMTRHMSATLMTAIAVATLTGPARAQEVTVESMPPSVVKTVPECGDKKVPATTKQIEVTFSKDMMTKKMWSWCMQSQASFPEITNQKGIKYLQDKRTCILPVKLKPGKTYAIWINTQKNNAFRDTKGTPAIPYLLVFKTK